MLFHDLDCISDDCVVYFNSHVINGMITRAIMTFQMIHSEHM